MALARLFDRIGLRIRQARPPMPQSGQPRGKAGMGVEAFVPVAEFSNRRVRGARLAAFALVAATSLLPVRAQNSAPPPPDLRTGPAAGALKERANAAGCDLPLVTTGCV